jgi:hypothetical protein
MNICVGSYGSRAVQKNCNIVVFKENDVPVMCLELHENLLIQAKMKHNKRPYGEYLKTIINWCKEKDINYKICSDIA